MHEFFVFGSLSAARLFSSMTTDACTDAISTDEFNALHSLYNSTNGDNWNWKSKEFGSKWNFTGVDTTNDDYLKRPCGDQWQGIICAEAKPLECYIESMDLSKYDLTGTIPNELLDLSSITAIIFDYNSLVGTLPVNIGILTVLDYLSVTSNFMTGPIPSSIGYLTKMEQLSLDQNLFTGQIPGSLGLLNGSLGFDVHSNILTGTIPSELGLLSHVTSFMMYDNLLNGSIPESFCSLSSAVDLYLYGNHLTGSIPGCLGSIASIVYLHLYDNCLTGSIPSQLGALPAVQELYLQSNSLDGSIPTSLGSLVSLLDINFDTNQLTGQIPTALFALAPTLAGLGVSGNLLSGPIPSQLASLSLLDKIELNTNRFTGTIPSSLLLLSALFSLYLSENYLTGSIPPQIENATLMEFIYLSNNYLTGPIPTTLNHLSVMYVLYLDNNYLTGAIPSSLGSLGHMQDLYANQNSLTGTIPSALGLLSNLHYLNLNTNSLTGTIPMELSKTSLVINMYLNNNLLTGKLDPAFFGQNFTIREGKGRTITNFPVLVSLDVSDNGFTGTFPGEVFTLPMLQVLAAGSNCFSAFTCPNETTLSPVLEAVILNGLSSGTSCRQFELAGISPNPGYIPTNFIGTSIPDCLWKFPNLTALYLVGNGFTGPINIPSTMEQPRLQYLRLAYNRLTGSIPAAIQERGNFIELDLSYNKLSGTLSSNFAFGQSSESTLNISVNRLSGAIPPNVNLTSISNIVNTVLLGNLLTFPVEAIATPERGEALLFNGSSQLDIAMIFTAPYLLIVLLFALDYYGFAMVIRGLLSLSICSCFVSAKKSVAEWWKRSGTVVQRGIGITIQTRRLLCALYRLMNIVVGLVLSTLLLGLVYIVLKEFPSLHAQYSTYTIEYAWELSSAYMHGVAPVVIIICLVVVLSVTCLLALLEFRSTGAGRAVVGEAAAGAADFAFVAGGVEGGGRWGHQQNGCCGFESLSRVMKTIVFVVINMVVMIAVNVGYLEAVLSQSKNLILIQFALATFKYLWNSIYIPSSIKTISKRANSAGDATLASSVDNQALLYQVSLLVVNSILVPCLATATTDASCFYELFVQTQSSSGLGIRVCPIGYQSDEYVGGQFVPECLTSTSQVLSSAFEPPFVYSYQCGSALVANYVPVLSYNFLLSGLVAPLGLLTILVNHQSFAAFLSRWVPLWVTKKLFNPIFMFSPSTQLSQSLLSRGSVSRVVNGRTVMAKLLLHIAVLLTFGLSSPYLSLLVGCSFFSIVAIWRIVIGRYLSENFRSQNSSTSPNFDGVSDDGLDSGDGSDGRADAHIDEVRTGSIGSKSGATRTAYGELDSVHDKYESVRAIDRALHGTWSEIFTAMCFVVLVAQLFWGLLSFDMIGDLYGYKVGLFTSIGIMAGTPTVTACLVVAYDCISRRQHSKQPQSLSAVPFAPSTSPDLEQQSTFTSGGQPGLKIESIEGNHSNHSSVDKSSLGSSLGGLAAWNRNRGGSGGGSIVVRESSFAAVNDDAYGRVRELNSSFSSVNSRTDVDRGSSLVELRTSMLLTASSSNDQPLPSLPPSGENGVISEDSI